MQDISIFVSTLGSGGAEKQAALLAKVLSSKYNVHFVALYGEYEISQSVLSILKEAGIKVYLLKGQWFSKIKSYAKILKENSVFCSFNYLTQCDFWGAIIERFCGVKTVYNGIRNSNMERYKVLLEYISHNYVATKTIFNCYSGENVFVKKGFKKHKCIIIPNCFPNIAEVMTRFPQGIKHIITVGRFVPQKDYNTALKAIAELKKKRQDFVFDIVGYGILDEEIRRWIDLYNITDVVKLHIKPNNIPELLKQADIYLSTSLFEGTSNSIMEALNWSLPVVATNVGDNNLLVVNDKNGLLHVVGDSIGISKSLNILLDNDDLRNTMGAEGNKRLQEYFSMNIFEKRYLELIEKKV